jgi:hypothetical protein
MASKTEIIAQVDSMRKELKRLKKLLKALPEETISAEKPKKAPRAKKDSSAPKKALNAWQSWTVYVKETYPEQMTEFAEADEANKKGLAPKFASYLRENAPEEYAEFVSDFKEKNPSPEKKPSAAKKPAATITKKAAAPAASAAASVSDSSDDEEEVDSDAGQWVWKGKTYFRTAENECWSEEGGKMKWAGVYDPIADVMDADAEEPEVEFD